MANVHRCRFVDYTPHSISNLAFSHPSSTKFAPTDLRLAVGRNNGDIEIWNPKTKWTHETTLFGGKDRTIEGIVWSTIDGDSPRLFSIGGSTILTEWDLKTGLPLVNFDCNAALIWSIAINESQDKIAVGCDDGTVVVVDISGGKGVIEHFAFLQRQDNRVLSLAFNKDNYIIGGCADGRIRVWDFQYKSESNNKFNLISTMKVDKSAHETTLIWSVLYLPKKNQIITGDSTGSIKFWDFEHFTLLQNFKVHEADVLTLTTDLDNENIFSAGVDRKINKFQYIKQEKKSGKLSRWINNSNRVYHSNDIRSIASFQSKNLNFLISAGVDKHIIVSSLSNFIDGEHKKISFIPQQSHVIINAAMKYVVLWQEQTVKIWKLRQRKSDFTSLEDDSDDGSDDEVEVPTDSYQLVAKLTLADEDNISTVAISQDGSILAVGRLSTTKLFKLTETSNSHKLKVKKIEELNLVNQGARLLSFYGNNSLILVNPENEVFRYRLNTESSSEHHGKRKPIIEYELSELPHSKSKLPFIENINNLKVFQSFLAVSRISGAVDIIDLRSSKESIPFLRLATYIHKLEITPRSTLLILTFENKLYEFDLKNIQSSNSHLTDWSKVNSEFLPKSFTSQSEIALGMFLDAANSHKVWFYGSNWLSYFDLSVNVPSPKNNKKRNRDGAQIEQNQNGNEIELMEAEDLSEEEFDGTLITATSKAERAKILKKKGSSSGKTAFWITQKYKPVLFAGSLFNRGFEPKVSDSEQDLIIIERPQFALSQPPAFKLHQFRV